MIHAEELSNGIRVVYEQIENFRSVSIGIWIKNGSIDEGPDDAGVSHFLEHMLFKGTDTRSARDIADKMAEVGGRINAFTAKEYTCYYAHTLDEDFVAAVDILADMLQNSTFKQEEIEKEKGVVAEEIAMSEDAPEDIVHDQLEDLIFEGSRLSNTILGSKEQILEFSQEKLKSYIGAHYVAGNMLVAVVGNVDRVMLIDTLERLFNKIPTTKPMPRESVEIVYNRVFKYREKDIEQVHLVLSFPAISYASDERQLLNVLNTIIGGGINSRLFLGIREDKGLTYSIYSYTELFLEAGIFNVYAAANPSQVEEVLVNSIKELEDFLEKGVSEKELFQVKQQIKSNLIIGFENMNNRMSSYGKTALMLGKIDTQDDLIDQLDAVTAVNLMAFAKRIIDFDKMSLSLVGRLSQLNIGRIESLCKK